jgi:putative tricarboxylic transport membrane protein
LKVNDAITGAMFLALAIGVFLYSGSFPAMRGVAYGPDLFPRIIAAMMALGGVVLIFGGLRHARTSPLVELANWARNPRSYVRFIAVVGGMLFYILMSDRLGFSLTAVVLLAGLLAVTRGPARLGSSLVIAVVVTAAMYFVFARMLRVPLPFGVIEILVLT